MPEEDETKNDNQDSSNDNPFEMLKEIHPQVLKAIKETSPLAVLSSLCIAVAALTQQTYPQIPVYAITAASLFLVAFTVALIFRIYSHALLAISTYISTAIAILMLFVVVYEFSKAIPMVVNSVNALFPLITSIVLWIGVGYMARVIKRKSLKIDSKVFSASIVLVMLSSSLLAIVGSTEANNIFCQYR